MLTPTDSACLVADWPPLLGERDFRTTRESLRGWPLAARVRRHWLPAVLDVLP